MATVPFVAARIDLARARALSREVAAGLAEDEGYVVRGALDGLGGVRPRPWTLLGARDGVAVVVGPADAAGTGRAPRTPEWEARILLDLRGIRFDLEADAEVSLSCAAMAVSRGRRGSAGMAERPIWRDRDDPEEAAREWIAARLAPGFRDPEIDVHDLRVDRVLRVDRREAFRRPRVHRTDVPVVVFSAAARVADPAAAAQLLGTGLGRGRGFGYGALVPAEVDAAAAELLAAVPPGARR
jgi:hypothetical protein